jgi:hypothetical protein
VSRQDGKRQLRHLREQRGWSWTDEARAIRDTARRLGMSRLAQADIGSIKRNIARWESEAAKATVPDERYQWLLAHLFVERDGQFNVGPGSDLMRLLSAFALMGVPAARITEVQVAVISWVERSDSTSSVRFGPLALDEATVAETMLSFVAVSGTVGKVPFVRSQLAVAPFLAALRDIDQTTKASSSVRILAARAFALAGRLAFELHDDQQARKHYATALAHARCLPDAWLAASLCTSITMVTMHRGDELAAAEKMANRAVRAALAGSSIAVRARAFAVSAEVAARRALVRPADTALAIAHNYSGQVPVDDPAGNGFDAAKLSGFVGLYHLLAGRGREAVEHLRDAARGVTEASDAVQRSIILADLAEGYVAQKCPEPEASVTVLHE